jgi:hypothetical protein
VAAEQPASAAVAPQPNSTKQESNRHTAGILAHAQEERNGFVLARVACQYCAHSPPPPTLDSGRAGALRGLGLFPAPQDNSRLKGQTRPLQVELGEASGLVRREPGCNAQRRHCSTPRNPGLYSGGDRTWFGLVVVRAYLRPSGYFPLAAANLAPSSLRTACACPDGFPLIDTEGATLFSLKA